MATSDRATALGAASSAAGVAAALAPALLFGAPFVGVPVSVALLGESLGLRAGVAMALMARVPSRWSLTGPRLR